MRFFRSATAGLALLALVATTACDAASGSTDDRSVAIVEPADGAQLTAPFTIKLRTGVPLGPTGSGRHHVHVYFDDHDDEYTIVEADTAQIPSVPAGRHTLHVSLRNANHTAAGAEASITVVGAGGPEPTDAPDDRYGY